MTLVHILNVCKASRCDLNAIFLIKLCQNRVFGKCKKNEFFDIHTKIFFRLKAYTGQDEQNKYKILQIGSADIGRRTCTGLFLYSRYRLEVKYNFI